MFVVLVHGVIQDSSRKHMSEVKSIFSIVLKIIL